MEKEQVKTLIMEQGYDNEIYSDEAVDHENALIEFLTEKGLEVVPTDLKIEIGHAFVDADSVAGIRAVVTILPYALDVHMVAFHHRQWDYYINEVKDSDGGDNVEFALSESKETTPTPDVVLLQTELEGGLNKNAIHQLTSMLPEKIEYVPFSTADNNSSAHGFIRASTLEQLDWISDDIEAFVQEIIGDVEKETADGYYTMQNGITLYIGYVA